MASRTAAPVLGTSPVLFPSWRNRSPRLNFGCVPDSEILHLDHAAHASRSAIYFGYGHDGGDGREGRRRLGRRSGRLARAQEFGSSVHRRIAEPDLRGPPHTAV